MIGNQGKNVDKKAEAKTHRKLSEQQHDPSTKRQPHWYHLHSIQRRPMLNPLFQTKYKLNYMVGKDIYILIGSTSVSCWKHEQYFYSCCFSCDICYIPQFLEKMEQTMKESHCILSLTRALILKNNDKR